MIFKMQLLKNAKKVTRFQTRTRTNGLSAKNNKIKTFEQNEGGLSQIIYLTPLSVIFIPSVTFEPPLNSCKISEKNIHF